MSGHVISQNMEFIRLALSQPILKIETTGLENSMQTANIPETLQNRHIIKINEFKLRFMNSYHL